MTSSKRALWVVVCLALLAAIPAVQSVARPPDCSVACTESSSCSAKCWDGATTTCGDWGVCNSGGGGGGCVPNYQVTRSIVAAVLPVDYFSYCDEVASYEHTHHDLNNCPGSSDYITCSYYTIHSHSYGMCCLDVYCRTSSSPCSP